MSSGLAIMIGILLLWAGTKSLSFDGVKAGIDRQVQARSFHGLAHRVEPISLCRRRLILEADEFISHVGEFMPARLQCFEDGGRLHRVVAQ